MKRTKAIAWSSFLVGVADYDWWLRIPSKYVIFGLQKNK